MEIPVYLFTGFLEAGKTKFIQETLESKEFDTGESTLVIICEEGEEELDKSKFAVKNVSVAVIEEPEEINVKNLTALTKKYKAERIIMEYNGMWMLDDLYSSLPKNWSVYQEIFTVNSETFVNYNQNMRSLVMDKLKSCELVMFNRVTPVTSLEELHKIVRAGSPRTSIAYEFTDGHVEEDNIEDPLPYDIEADIIEIADKDYAIWYRDLGEHPERYVGKMHKFKGIAGRDKQLGDCAFIFGRHVMTCCEADIAFRGLICKTKEPTNIKNRDWLTVTGKLVVGEHKAYGGEGPMIIVKEFEKSEKPDPEVASFF